MSNSASNIIKALALKHKEDVFVPECKDGPTAFGSHARMDAWVMKKKWAHPLVIGYEVKVSRSDFLGDSKWRSYLPLCNELCFVAPKGLIKDGELSPEVGLMEVVGNSRLVTRKKAQYREVVVPEELYRYILMARAQITRETSDNSRRDHFKNWLEEKKEDRKLGYNVSRAIRDHVERVGEENRQLKVRMDNYDSIKAFMVSVGLNPEQSVYTWNVERKYKELQAAIPVEFEESVKSLRRSLDEMELALTSAKGKS